MSPFTLLFLALIVVPLVEIYLLISVGRVIGAGTTILVVIGTAILGALLLRWQGLNTFARFQQTIQQGQLPAQELLEGLILIVTGALLLTPGFFTDGIGFLMLLPPVRGWLARRMLAGGWQQVHVRRGPDDGTVVIDGEYRRTDADKVEPPPRHLPPDDDKAS